MKCTILRALVGTGVLLALLGTEADAAKVKVWHHSEQTHFENARFHKTVISDQGTVRLSRELKLLADLKTQHIWDLAEDKNGNLFVATGDEGKLFKVSPEGEVTVVYNSPDSQILSLAAAPDGSIFAGTGPTGTLVRIPPKGKPHVVAEDLDSYVWALVLDPETSTLYAGTGPRGRIYQVTADGQATVFYTTKQNHVLSLARAGNKMLYAGTDKGGMVYRISAQGKGFVLYTAPQSEVRSLLVTAKGVYAGTSSPAGKHKSQTVVSGGSNFTPMEKDLSVPLAGQKETQANDAKPVPAADSSSSDEGEASEPAKGKPAPSVPPPAAGENSLYFISPDGIVAELFREKAMILSMVKQNGTVLVGTGMKGQLFEIDEQTRERTEIARLDHGQIHCMLQRRDGTVVLGAGDPGKLYALGKDYAASGTVTSEVLDAKLISRWGAALCRGTTGNGNVISLAFRSGNVPTPDDTWSDWSAEQTDVDGAKITSPNARFLQYRVTLKTSNQRTTPVVHSVTLRYVTTNHAPEVSKIEVPDLDGTDLEKPEKIKIKWRATDPNEDELTFRVYVRKQGWQSWVCVKENLSSREYQWDADSMPPGLYQVKIAASDHKDNTEQEALTASAISTMFPVSNLPPQVTLKVVTVENGKAVLEATADDPMLRISHASFAVNGKSWVNVFPQDGIFDSKSESFFFPTPVLPAGNHVVVLRVRNAAGIVGTADAVFTVPASSLAVNSGEE